ncbi:hypothetical protein QTP70_005819 [Hemibagrus guttatus]|uniref:Retrotransposon gag domain-containing protein n=1 Tax=Hemibagrus guttatus TaxID=175788 RepID=A0AAE0RBN3_9TELE|nr:hypothetical protein QTP70_005819 [Hemibagrus guttatus]
MAVVVNPGLDRSALSVYPGVSITPSLPTSSLTPSSFQPQIPAGILAHVTTAQATDSRRHPRSPSSAFRLHSISLHFSPPQLLNKPSQDYLCLCPRSVYNSALLYALACWNSRLKEADSNSLNRLICKASDVVGEELDSLMIVSERRMLSKCEVFFSHQLGMYREEGTKCAFLMSLLTDRALEWASAVWDADSQIKASYDYFAGMIREVFEYPAGGKDISVRLMELRQASDAVADYAIRFRMLAVQRRGSMGRLSCRVTACPPGRTHLSCGGHITVAVCGYGHSPG